MILLIIKLLCSHLPKYLFFGEEGVCQTAEKCCYRQTSEKPTIVLFALVGAGDFLFAAAGRFVSFLLAASFFCLKVVGFAAVFAGAAAFFAGALVAFSQAQLPSSLPPVRP